MDVDQIVGLHEYYQGLSQIDRTMMLLYYVDELMPREIASVMEMGVEEVVVKLVDLRKNAGNSMLGTHSMKITAYA